MLSSPPAFAASDTLVLAIQPVLNEAKTRAVFKPLAKYIENATGIKCVIRTSPNFFAYWDTTRKGKDYNLVFDAAHFTDYRIQKFGYQVLAKLPDTVSYSLVVRDDLPIIDPLELVGRSIVTLGVPSVGAARLNAMFPNPARQPITVEAASTEEGMKMLLDKKVFAAIMPTPIIARHMAEGAGIQLVTTTEPIPHMAISAATSVDSNIREKIRRALLTANVNNNGIEMLKRIGFERFEPATADIYKGYSATLKEYWGY